MVVDLRVTAVTAETEWVYGRFLDKAMEWGFMDCLFTYAYDKVWWFVV